MSSRPDIPASEHVVDLVADYVLDRLDAERRAYVREHLTRCEECRHDFQWSAAFHAELHHLAADRVVALAEGASSTSNELEHLQSCEECRHEVDVMRALELPPPARTVRTARRRPSARWQNWGLGALATAAVLLLMVQPWRSGIDLAAVRGLSQVEPLPVRVPRAIPQPNDFDTLRSTGLEAYADGLYDEAKAALEQAAQLDDTDEIRLYLGSSRGLTGDVEQARADLQMVIGRAQRGPLAEAARWQLANLQLAQGSVRDAVALLQTVAAEGQRFRGPAERLLEQLTGLGVDTRNP